ncbi:hypothetical protein ASG81_22875 [Paenibacillus sp. Soil522]|nr:hypothetical protein ASG81_22875 [Paenibacillus sp. Soil522]
MIHLKKNSHANPLIDLEFKVVLQQPWEGGTDQWVLEIIGIGICLIVFISRETLRDGTYVTK